MATPTYQQLIQMLSKAESEAGDGAVFVAELLAAKFSWRSLEYRKTWIGFWRPRGELLAPLNTSAY